MRSSEPASFSRENEIVFVISLQVFVRMASGKMSPQNVGELVFLESQKGKAMIIQNNFIKFITYKE